MDKSLIVIDDEPQFADLLSEVAKTAGFETTVCNDAREYFDAAQEFTVMVLDLNMPSMDGVEVIRRMGSLGHHSHLILVSGYDSGVLHSAEKLAEEHQLNVVGSLNKPLQISDFVAMLNSIETEKDSGLSQQHNHASEITVDEVKQAIAEEQLVLYYQPQIDLATNELKGVEALVRWQHPTRGLIPPGIFIPIAETNGLMAELTALVINQAVSQSNEWKQLGFKITVSVNVSAENITSLYLPEHLTDLINDHDLDPQSIVLEITESALMGELKTSLDILTRLRMKGFGLSIDDFGTGNSSLVLLHRVPFTELKIDMSFVRYMDRDVDAYSIVETCVMLAHKLHMSVVAEGVENRKIQLSLRQMGCDIGQGFEISKPMPAEEIPQWILSHKIREVQV